MSNSEEESQENFPDFGFDDITCNTGSPVKSPQKNLTVSKLYKTIMDNSFFNNLKFLKKSAMIGNTLNNLNKFLDKINNCREKLV